MQLGRSSRWMGAVALATALAAGGCAESGDIGRPCVLVRSDGDGGVTELTNGELQPNTDIVSVGSFECEDFICVRHRYAAIEGDDGDPALGVCSRGCTVGDPRGCTGLAPEASLSDGLFSCRALVLDPETLAELCRGENPPPICGNIEQSNYCAQGAIPPGAKDAVGTDAGT